MATIRPVESVNDVVYLFANSTVAVQVVPHIERLNLFLNKVHGDAPVVRPPVVAVYVEYD